MFQDSKRTGSMFKLKAELTMLRVDDYRQFMGIFPKLPKISRFSRSGAWCTELY